jgi:hypothetical protein
MSLAIVSWCQLTIFLFAVAMRTDKYYIPT